MKTLCKMLFVLALSGCATPYQGRSFSGGFSETQLSPNVFQVSFAGNGYTSEEKAADFTLLRSAELALQHGYGYFVIVDEKSWQTKSVRTAPTTTQTTYNGNTLASLNASGSYGTYSGTTMGTATTRTYGGQSFVISKPQKSNTIVCFTAPPESASFVLDAQFLQQSLKAKYKM